MDNNFILYDETEPTSTRYIGYAGEHGRYDLAITTTGHFYGKKLVCDIQNGRTAIMNDADASNLAYVMQVFNISDEEAAREFSDFLLSNL